MSVAKRKCARGLSCYQVRVLKLEEPPNLRVTRKSNFCEKCEDELANVNRTSGSERWEGEVTNAIEALFASRPESQWPDRASLWDLFNLEQYNGGHGKPSDRGFVLSHLQPETLLKLKDWLDNNSQEAVKKYGYNRWLHLRTVVGIGAWVKQLPRDMDLSPDTEDGLPIQITAIRTDGKKWDLNIPIRLELLRLMPRYFSEREYKRLLGIGRTSYRRMKLYMKQESFTLQKFASDVLERIVRGERRGPKQNP